METRKTTPPLTVGSSALFSPLRLLVSAEGKRLKWKGDYVPNDLLAIGDNGYGDYIIMKISAEGIIEGWPTPRLRSEDWENTKGQS